MRRVLVDFARHRLAQRRGEGEKPESLDENASFVRTETSNPEGILQIGLLMEQLEKSNLDVARVVDMHYFAGFTLQEISEITGLTLRQVRHLWEKGRDWLQDRLV
jgi:RNA polymerase sigma factor (sigma-70 family)